VSHHRLGLGFGQGQGLGGGGFQMGSRSPGLPEPAIATCQPLGGERAVGRGSPGDRGQAGMQFGPGGAEHQAGLILAHGQGQGPEFVAGLPRGYMDGVDLGAGTRVEARAHEQIHAVLPGVGHGLGVHHPAAPVGEILHLVIVEPFDAAGGGNVLGIGRHHPGNILEDLATLGTQGMGQSHGRGVAATASKGGDLLGLATHTLEAGDDHHLALVQHLGHPDRAHGEDAGIGMAAIGDDAGLAAGEAHCGDSLGVQGHAQQRHADALAHGEQHVQLPSWRSRIGLAGLLGQAIGGVTHGAHHHHQPLAGVTGRFQVAGHGAQALDIGQAAAAVFAHDDGTGGMGAGLGHNHPPGRG